LTGSAMLGFFALGYFLSFAALGVLVALYTVASTVPRRVSIRVGLVSAVVLVVITVMSREPFEVDAILAEGLLVGAAWFLGDALRIRRTQVRKLEELAARLEHEREQVAHAAVARERRVIARELHDVVAHNVSVIAAQAGAAQRVFDSAPDDALASLGSIEGTAREALGEMRRLTGFLRTDSDGVADWSPQPGLGSISTLLDQVRDTGVDVSLRIEGEPRPIPAGLDLTAYRITQEALTNVMKHAGRARTQVVLTYHESTIELRIEDEGSALPAGPTTEHRPPFGHLGMRERVALFGGLLRVGQQPHGGFAVEAILPIDGVAATGTDVEPSG
jgi:signal transduction histidine kinase